MSKNDLDSLSSLNQFGDQIKIYVAEVKGRFKRLRVVIHTFMILFFLVMPWVTINGEQALLFNIADRQFSFFGMHFWAHDGPLIFFVLAIITLSLAFFTAIFGRIWCGWACPQTVFIEQVFRLIEYVTEGNYIKRKKLDTQEFNAEKLFKKASKWFLFIISTLIITHSFLAYFVGSTELLDMIQSSPLENWTSFLFILVTSIILLFNFAIFREQFCIIMCPYGRFQSVLLDSHSLTVSYDKNRGEPRKAKDLKEPQGDCISCNRCVNVCPTAIDIRNGSQMECIQCTACIDACDEIMDKINKPRGLIRYSSEAVENNITQKIIRPRVVIYFIAIIFIVVALFAVIHNRQKTYVSILRGTGQPYTYLGQDKKFISNSLNLKLQNQTLEPQKLFIQQQAPQLKDVDIIIPENPVLLQAGEIKKELIIIKLPSSQKIEKVKMQAIDLSKKNSDSIYFEVPIITPKGGPNDQ